MKSTSELINLIYGIVKDSALADEITGTIYKRIRPNGSLTEDIVINCLPTGNANVQDATVNLNIYVPDLESKSNSTNQFLPDTKRIEELESIANTVFTDVNASGYWFDVQFISVIQESEINQHFINVRLNIKYINL